MKLHQAIIESAFLKHNPMTRSLPILLATLLAVIFILPSCTVVREGEVGVKRKLGKYKGGPIDQGVASFNPFTTRILKVSTQTENMRVETHIPSKEGLNIKAEISILYSIDPNEAPELLRQIGRNYEKAVIMPVFRSAVADVSARYFAKDMHTGQRARHRKRHPRPDDEQPRGARHHCRDRPD